MGTEKKTALFWLRHFVVGACATAFYIVALDLMFHLPCAIALGLLPQVTEEPWRAVFFSVPINASVVLAAVWLFMKRPSDVR